MDVFTRFVIDSTKFIEFRRTDGYDIFTRYTERIAHSHCLLYADRLPGQIVTILSVLQGIPALLVLNDKLSSLR